MVLSRFRTLEAPAGTRLVRVATDHLGATEPSASERPRRFSPVRDADRGVVPVLYAADDLGCALGETVFHDLDDSPTVPGVVFRADLLALRASFIEVRRSLTLVDLTDAALGRLGTTRAELVATGPSAYLDTVGWAQRVWDETSAAGIVWNSRRSPARRSFLLFVDPARHGDRARSVRRRNDLDVWREPLPLHGGRGFGEVQTAASARNVAIVL